jgi:hypothetical protein
MSNPFHWNHRGLDQVCGRLHDFSTLLFSTKDGKELDMLWDLVKERLYSNIQNASLQTFFFDERAKDLSDLKSTHAKTADVILFRKAKGNGNWDQALIQHLQELPGAVLAFAEGTPVNWNTLFDITLELRDPVCRILRRDQANEASAEQVSFTFDENLGQKPLGIASSAASTQTSSAASTASSGTSSSNSRNLNSSATSHSEISPPNTVYFLEVDSISQKTLAKGITFASIHTSVITADQPVPAFRRGDFLITDLSEDHPKLADFLDRSKLNSVPVVVLGKRLKRVEDRLRLYEWGATLVLPKEASTAEQMAAIISLLKYSGHSEVSARFAMEEWDEELQRLSQKVKRDLTWSKDQLPDVLDYYKTFVAHLIKRSHHSGTPCGVVRIPLPDLSALVTKKESWVNLMRRTLLQSLIATVRQRDITFVYEDNLVIISGDLSPLSSTYVVKRIQAQLESLGEKAVKVERFSFQPETADRNNEAEELLKKSVKGLVGEASA